MIPKLSIVIMSRPLSLQPTGVVEQFTITPEHTLGMYLVILYIFLC